MQSFVAFAAILACAAAAPGLLVSHQPVVTHISAPVVHTIPVVAAKTTITKSSQIVNHGSPVHSVHAVHAAPILHAPIVHAPVVHSAPLVHAPVVHASPVIIKTAPAAISHSSSVVHHGAVVKSVPILAVHH